jgi:hypothetical protein
MLHKYIALLTLSLAALACAIPGAPPTTGPGQLATSAAATLAALSPTTTAAPPATSTPLPPPASPMAEPFVCALAYADSGTLFCLAGSGEPRLLAQGPGLTQPEVSPDGRWVAYKVAVSEGVAELWVADAQSPDGGSRMLVSNAQVPNADPAMINSARDYQWRGGTTSLVFDTMFVPREGIMGPGDFSNNDLWVVDAVSGAVTPLLPADAGKFSVSPDGAFIAIARPTSIDLVNADGTNYRRDLLVYPAIVTYSEYAYRPDVVWSTDSLYFSLAVPSPDPLAPDTHVSLYQVGVDGIVQPRSTIAGNFVFGGMIPARISPDGQSLVFALNRDDSSVNYVHRVRVDGSSNVVVDEKDMPVGWGWSPDSAYYAYSWVPQGGAGSGFVIEPNLNVQPFAPNLTAIRDLQWLDASSLAFVGRIGGGDWSLYRLALGQEPQLLAAGLGEVAELDVR